MRLKSQKRYNNKILGRRKLSTSGISFFNSQFLNNTNVERKYCPESSSLVSSNLDNRKITTLLRANQICFLPPVHTFCVGLVGVLHFYLQPPPTTFGIIMDTYCQEDHLRILSYIYIRSLIYLAAVFQVIQSSLVIICYILDWSCFSLNRKFQSLSIVHGVKILFEFCFLGKIILVCLKIIKNDSGIQRNGR